MNDKISNSPDVQIVAPQIGEALKKLVSTSSDSSHGQLSLKQFIEATPDLGSAEVLGAISLLQTMGLVSMDSDGNVGVPSKYANFALDSLSEFLIQSMRISSPDHSNFSEIKYLQTLTRAMETIRKEKIETGRPLHSRDIVNVIIKGKQVRGWREKDVYLHVFHKKWRAYHLIGLGRKIASRSDDELAERAMEIKLRLEPYQYEIETSLDPQPITYIAISGSHGAITKYSISTRVVKTLNVDLNNYLQNLIDEHANGIDVNSFRWFTKEEIDRGKSDNGEDIIQSTPRVLSNVSDVLIPYAVNKAEYIKKEPGLKTILSNRLTWQRGVLLLSLLLTSFFMMFFLDDVIAFINTQNEVLNILADISQILGMILAFFTLILALKSSY